MTDPTIEHKRQITLRQIDLALMRARLYEKRIETGAWRGRVVHKGGSDGPLMTGKELVMDEIATMQRHLHQADQLIDYLFDLIDKEQAKRDKS